MTTRVREPVAGRRLRMIEKTRKQQTFAIMMAVPMLIAWVGGTAIMGLEVPLSPAASAESIADFVRDNATRIQIGASIAYVSVFCLFPFSAAIAAQLRRAEGVSPVMTYWQVSAIGTSVVTFVLAFTGFEILAFRPDRPASETQLINDATWLVYVWTYAAFTSWMFAIGIAILMDQREHGIYPRWVGYLNFFVGVAFLPDSVAPMFHEGPFCWRGFYPYWFTVASYVVWIVVMTIWTRKAIDRQAEDQIATSWDAAWDAEERATSSGPM